MPRNPPLQKRITLFYPFFAQKMRFRLIGTVLPGSTNLTFKEQLKHNFTLP